MLLILLVYYIILLQIGKEYWQIKKWHIKWNCHGTSSVLDLEKYLYFNIIYGKIVFNFYVVMFFLSFLISAWVNFLFYPFKLNFGQIHIRHSTLYKFKKASSLEVTRNIHFVYGKEALSAHTCGLTSFKWENFSEKFPLI